MAAAVAHGAGQGGVPVSYPRAWLQDGQFPLPVLSGIPHQEDETVTLPLPGRKQEDAAMP